MTERKRAWVTARLKAASFQSDLYDSLLQGESHFEGSVQLLPLGARQGTDEAGQLHLAEAYEVIAEDPAFVLQAFVDADRDLSGEAVTASQDGCADDGGKFGIDQGLAAYDYEATIEFGVVPGMIVARMMNAIDFAPSHRLRLLGPQAPYVC
jgi:hypothetical protein